MIFCFLATLILLPMVSARVECCRWDEYRGFHGCYSTILPSDCDEFILQYDDTTPVPVAEEIQVPLLSTVQWTYVILAIIGIFILLIIAALISLR